MVDAASRSYSVIEKDEAQVVEERRWRIRGYVFNSKLTSSWFSRLSS